MKKKNKKKSVVDRINEKQMRMEWDFASRELRGYTDKEIHGTTNTTIHNG
jgi:hypothetical protein